MAAQQQKSTRTPPAEASASAPASNGAETVLSNYLSEETLAAQLGVATRTVRRWRKLRQSPPYLVISRQVYYRQAAVAEWLRSRERSFDALNGGGARRSASR
jgi:hypothetical protein